MTVVRPSNAPHCWGIQFEDGNRECNQCSVRDTCRPVTMARLTAPPAPPSPLPPQSFIQPPKPMAPQFAPVPYYPQPAAPPQFVPQMTYPPPLPQPLFRSPTPVAAAPQYQPAQYQPIAAPQVPQQAQQWAQPSIPDPYNPNPLIPMHRPGVQGTSYFFTQYPGETVPQRLAKNMALRGLEAVFCELMFFFRHWTWPPKPPQG